MTKKILLIIGILVIIGIAIFLIFSSRPPATPGENRVGFSILNFLPFGNSGSNNGTNTNSDNGNQEGENTSSSTPGVNQPIPRLRKLSNEPVAGAVIFNTGSTSVVRFEEKGTGNVYEARSDSLDITRLTNTTIPKIVRAFWLPDASGFLAQTLVPDSEMIETDFVKLAPNTASSSQESLTPFTAVIGKLPTGIKEIAVKPDSSKIFYYTISPDTGYSNWFVSNPDGTGSELVMTHPLTEWIPKWVSGNNVLMQSKASANVMGFSYFFDVKNKILAKTGLGLYGLSISPNPDGSLGIASIGGNYPQLSLVDFKNVTSRNLSEESLAEKCVWSNDKAPSVYCAVPYQIPTGNYPDSWYQGVISTIDLIEKINVSTDVSSGISNLTSDSGEAENIDVENMSISPDGAYLIFQNKVDGYLWMLRIAE